MSVVSVNASRVLTEPTELRKDLDTTASNLVRDTTQSGCKHIGKHLYRLNGAAAVRKLCVLYTYSSLANNRSGFK